MLINSLSSGIVDINTKLDNNTPKDLLKQSAYEMKAPKTGKNKGLGTLTLDEIIAQNIKKDILRKSKGK